MPEFNELTICSEFHYPSELDWPDCTLSFTKVTPKVFAQLKSCVPENTGSCTFNKVLWIIGVDETFVTGIYQADDQGYLVNIREDYEKSTKANL